mmetsp:Transcript_22695/g.38028  ORF Transcript_22695/g.38028 Transcript_22695/m.38028 type:complete len:589 (+) Transcript_22695:40-1806(+)
MLSPYFFSALKRGRLGACRRYLSHAKQAVTHRPPFLIRTGIIGSSITLATPAFTVAGLFRIWTSVMPKTQSGRFTKYVIGTVIGGGTATLFYNYIGPALWDYSDILLPFALSNGIACVVWQIVGEVCFGLEMMVAGTTVISPSLPFIGGLLSGPLPLAGAAIGALTSLTAPLLWPLMTRLCWTEDLHVFLLGENSDWLYDAYYSLSLPVVIPVGVLSGVALQSLLRPVLLGIPSRPWYLTSLPVLVLSVAGCGVFYASAPFRGTSVHVEDFMWTKRLNVKTGEPISVNKRTGAVLATHATADKALFKRNLVRGIHVLRSPFSGLLRGLGERPKEVRDNPINEIDDETSTYELMDVLVRRRYLLNQLASATQSNKNKNNNSHNSINNSSNNDTSNKGPDANPKYIQGQLAALETQARQRLGLNTSLEQLQYDAELLCLLSSSSPSSSTTKASAAAAKSAGLVEKQLHGGSANPNANANPNDSSENTLLLTKVQKRLLNAYSGASLNGSKDTKIALQRLTENPSLLVTEFETQIGYKVVPPTKQEQEQVLQAHKQQEEWNRLYATAVVLGVPITVAAVLVYVLGLGSAKD